MGFFRSCSDPSIRAYRTAAPSQPAATSLRSLPRSLFVKVEDYQLGCSNVRCRSICAGCLPCTTRRYCSASDKKSGLSIILLPPWSRSAAAEPKPQYRTCSSRATPRESVELGVHLVLVDKKADKQDSDWAMPWCVSSNSVESRDNKSSRKLYACLSTKKNRHVGAGQNLELRRYRSCPASVASTSISIRQSAHQPTNYNPLSNTEHTLRSCVVLQEFTCTGPCG